MKKWALVLSGGGGRGIAYAGVFKALEKLDLHPDMLVGCSIGAVMGGIYASGVSAGELEDFILHTFELKFYLESVTYRLGDGAFFRFLQAQEALSSLVGSRGVASGRRIHRALLELTRGRTFEQSRPRFLCNAVDLLTGREVVMDSGLLADGIRPSMSVPGLFAPVERNGMLLADGGILNNLPVWIPRERGIRRVIAVNCSPFTPISPDEIPKSPFSSGPWRRRATTGASFRNVTSRTWKSSSPPGVPSSISAARGSRSPWGRKKSWKTRT